MNWDEAGTRVHRPEELLKRRQALQKPSVCRAAPCSQRLRHHVIVHQEAAALYEPPFIDLHAGGPDELFARHESVIEGIFEKLRAVRNHVPAMAG